MRLDPEEPREAVKALDLTAIKPGDEITVRLTVTSTLPGDIPLFNIGGPIDGFLAPRPHWINAEQIVGHYPVKS